MLGLLKQLPSPRRSFALSKEPSKDKEADSISPTIAPEDNPLGADTCADTSTRVKSRRESTSSSSTPLTANNNGSSSGSNSNSSSGNSSRRSSYYASSMLNSSQADLGIAMILRSKQEQRLGNDYMANQLYVDGLEQLANAITDTSGIESQQQRERLEMLKLILGNSNTSNNCSIPGTTRLQHLQSSPSSIKYNYANHSNLTTTGEKFSEALWIMLTFVFAFIGDAIIWSAAAFQESRLPELILNFLAWAFQTICHISATLQIPERSIAFGQYVLNNFISLDQKTLLSQKVYLALLSVFQALLGLVEIKTPSSSSSTTTNTNRNSFDSENHHDGEFPFYKSKYHYN